MQKQLWLNTKTEQLESDFREFYEVAKVDAAHGWDHIQEVLGNLRLIVDNHERLGFALDVHTVNLATMAVYAHDIFAYNRKTHHLESAQWMREHTEYFTAFYGISHEDVERVALACERHRASFKGTRDDIVQDLMAAADYGCSDVFPTFKRALRYRGEDTSAAIMDAVDHITDKYYGGAGDYAPIAIETTDIYRIGYGKAWARKSALKAQVAVRGADAVIEALGGLESYFWEGVI